MALSVYPWFAIKLRNECKSSEKSACNLLFDEILVHEDKWDGICLAFNIIPVLTKYLLKYHQRINRLSLQTVAYNYCVVIEYTVLVG